MSEKFLYNLPPEEKTRLGYLDNGHDLFETKIFRIQSQTIDDNKSTVLVATRDSGSANALVPVIKELCSDTKVEVDILTDGRAQEIIKKNFDIDDITPSQMILGADQHIGQPQVLLIDHNFSEPGLDTYVSTTFGEVPIILLEDYYGTANHLLDILSNRGLPLPQKICVMDKYAKEIIVKEFPSLESRIEVTGQPIYDRFALENTELKTFQTKEKLGLMQTDKLVVYMSTMDEPEKIKQVADSLVNISEDFYFVFRCHPRDNTSYDVFEKILTEAGIKVLNTDGFNGDDIMAASDIVLTTWSTAGLEGMYLGKPTVHLVDPNFVVPEGLELPLPQVKLGASVGIGQASELTMILPQLFDKKSKLNADLKNNMKKYYFADGKNAKRVADVVKEFLVE